MESKRQKAPPVAVLFYINNKNEYFRFLRKRKYLLTKVAIFSKNNN